MDFKANRNHSYSPVTSVPLRVVVESSTLFGTVEVVVVVGSTKLRLIIKDSNR